MTALDPTLYLNIVETLRDEFGDDLLMVALTGSAYIGMATPLSDVDICVLTNRPFFQRQRRIIGSQRVDIFVDPPERIIAIIEGRQTRFLTWMYSHCRILFDPSGTGKSIVKRATQIWAEGPRLPPESLRFKYRSELVDVLSNLAEASDPATVKYLIGMMLPIALDAYWAENRDWGTHRKRALQLLAKQDPTLHALYIDLLLDRGSMSSKKRLAAQIVDRVLGAGSDVKAFNEYLGPVITFRKD